LIDEESRRRVLEKIEAHELPFEKAFLVKNKRSKKATDDNLKTPADIRE
jgi:hypothetical protein